MCFITLQQVEIRGTGLYLAALMVVMLTDFLVWRQGPIKGIELVLYSCTANTVISRRVSTSCQNEINVSGNALSQIRIHFVLLVGFLTWSVAARFVIM